MMKSIGNDRSNKIWEASIGSNFKKILPTDDRFFFFEIIYLFILLLNL